MTVGVVCDSAVFKLRDKFLLVLVAFFGEVLHGICFGNLYAAEVFLAAGKFQHLVLNGLEVCLREGSAAHVYVIVEAVFNCGPNAELHAGEKGLQGLCHKVGGRVPEHALGFVVFPLEEADLNVLGDGTHHVYGCSFGCLGLIRALDVNCQHIRGKAGADAHCHVITCYARFILTYASIRELNVDHNLI